MIKKIIHISDLHIRPYSRHDEFRHVAEKFFTSIEENVFSQYKPEEVRIVIVGDLVHQKINVTNELHILLHWFLDKCTSYCKTIIVAGNHDAVLGNKSRMDSITPTFNLLQSPHKDYFKESKCYVDDNVVWCNYSVFEDNKKPDIDKELYGDDKTYIGLFHAPVFGACTDIGYEFDTATALDIFEGCDAVLLGDVHKRQKFVHRGIPIVYSGSFLQNNFGETVSGHGYLLWDVESRFYIEFDIESDYGFYKFKLDSLDDLGNEILANG